MKPDLDLETRREREGAKLTWLREAATEAFASLDRGKGRRFDSREELDAYIMKISEEVFAETV